MLFLEIDWAIYKRLTGYPLDSKGRPQLDSQTNIPVNREVIGPAEMNGYDQIWDPIKNVYIPAPPVLPSYGIRVPLMVAPFRGARGLSSMDPDATRAVFGGLSTNEFRQVPVFDTNLEGRSHDDIYPAVTFNWSDTEYEPKTFIYSDPIGGFDMTSAPVQLKDSAGNVVQSGFSNGIQRPNPESWNAIYTITARAKSKTELALICHQIMGLFPGKGALTIQFQDQSTHTCDMLLQRVVNLDEGGEAVLATQGQEEQRAYGRSFVYLVEAYYDNTSNQFGVQDVRSAPVILQRLFELDDLVTNAVQMASTDLNLQELAPIPPQGV